jgi:multiple sugar transport system permease protein
MMAASVIVMLPVLILFFVGQRYFIQGVVFTGLKQ